MRSSFCSGTATAKHTDPTTTTRDVSDLSRRVQVTLSDGDSGTSIPVTKSIQVILKN